MKLSAASAPILDATLAKASKATLYRRWRTKEELVLAVLGPIGVVQPGRCGRDPERGRQLWTASKP